MYYCNLRARLAACLVAVSGIVGASVVDAAVIAEHRYNTSNIQVPTFNTALGTLQHAQVTVTMLSGQTNTDGHHVHGVSTSQVISTNTVIADSVTPFSPKTYPTTTAGTHSHIAYSPSYSGGGLSFSPFSLSVSDGGAHTHQVTLTYAGTQMVNSNPFGSDTQRVRAEVQGVSTGGLHSHSYGSASQTQNFSGAGLVPFLAAGDIVVPGYSFLTNSGSTHSHVLSSFSFIINTSTGPQVVNFPSINMGSAGSPSHLINPRFDTTATFTYEPVPEPTALALVAAGSLCLLRRR